MSTEEKGPDSILDRAISEIRNEPVDPAAVSKAAERVWANLSAAAAPSSTGEIDAIRSCADFQALIPAWREGRLSPSRAMLVEDHTRACPACRKALAGARQPIVLRPKRVITPVWKWAAAAAVVIAAGLGVYFGADRVLVAPGARASVASVDGTVYRVTAEGNTPLALGASIAESESVRTARGSRAVVRLRDGSLVEMRERTELALNERRSGVTIRLAAGDIIVQAAKQRSRHLYVSTDDCLVSVTGTVFAVDHGVKGSRVSVVQGEVHVTHGRETTVLHPGEQVTTTASLTAVPIEQDVAWSRNVDQYTALLNELGKLRQRFEAIPAPGQRYSTRLLDLMPEGTVFYAAIPNLGSTLAEADRILHEELAQSQPLRQWWDEKVGAAGEAKLSAALSRVQALGAYLGPEIAIGLGPNGAGGEGSPLILAEVVRSGFRDFVAGQVSGQEGVTIVDDPLHATPTAKAVHVYVSGNLAAVSPDLAQLKRLAAVLAQPGQNSFVKAAFHDRIAQAYRGGVEWLLAADLHTMAARAMAQESAQRTGFADAQYLIVEHKSVAGQTENRATLTFTQQRRGIASWLAAPAPIRALDFVSADASLATAAVIKNPAALVDDVFSMAQASSSDFLSHLSEFEATTGLSVREDLARPLGGEFAFAIDGPLLPVPSWKLVLEVYDAPRFEQAIERLIDRANQEAAQHPAAPKIQIAKEEAGGRTYYSLKSAKMPFEIHYTYDSGFLIAAPSRDLIDRALGYRSTGYSLVRSAKFTALLPRDGHTDFSAMFYHTLGTALSSLAGNVTLTPEQQKSLQAAAAAAGPALVLAYGQPDRIELASSGTFFGLRIEQLLGMGALHSRKR